MNFSIIVPVYNASLFLRRCLDSIFAQTYMNFEVVAVDYESKVFFINSYKESLAKKYNSFSDTAKEEFKTMFEERMNANY